MDANECRENAKRCVTLAARTTDPLSRSAFSKRPKVGID